MAKKEAFNYKEAFEHPIMIFQLTDKFVLPFGVRLSRIIAFAVVLLIMLLFRDFFFAIGSIVPGFSLVIFGGFPFLISGWLLKINVDGKKLHYFLYDFSLYFFSQKIGKKKFCNDMEVQYHNEKIELEKWEWRVK
ncbi:hypothetical protein ARX99_06815 [Listeria monocytogenes]|nr:hypothetical protein [Listeria monocytogenes]EAC4829760.1 hypothetical protein [Listeria monocytogenes]